MGTIASQITSLTMVFSTVYLDTDRRKHQCSASLAIVRGIHWRPVISPHKWPVTRKMLPLDDIIMNCRSFPIIKLYALYLTIHDEWIRGKTCNSTPISRSWKWRIIRYLTIYLATETHLTPWSWQTKWIFCRRQIKMHVFDTKLSCSDLSPMEFNPIIPIENKSTLVQVRTCLLFRAKPLPDQRWHDSLTPYGVTVPQWVELTGVMVGVIGMTASFRGTLLYVLSTSY